jgi:hypothetical protein
MAESILLNCSILGSDVERVFQVEILHNKTVAHLKEAIKQKKPVGLAYIDADKLDIWKVSEPAQRAHRWHVTDDIFSFRIPFQNTRSARCSRGSSMVKIFLARKSFEPRRRCQAVSLILQPKMWFIW